MNTFEVESPNPMELEVNTDISPMELEVSSPNPMQLNVDPIEEIEVEIPDFIVTSPRDYNILDNKPKINNVTLIGNKTSDDLGLLSKVPTAVNNNVVIFASSGKIGDSGIAIGNVLTKSSIINNLTSTATDAPLSAKMGKELNDIKVDKVAGKGLSTNDFTDALKNKLDGVETGAQVNKLEKIFVNGNEQTILPGKKVDISVPTKTSDITNDSGFIDKDVNNLTYYKKTSELADVALSGDYNDLSNKPTIPTKTSQLTNDSGYIDKDVDDLTYYKKTSELADVALSGDYNDLTNKPTIGNAQITIKKNGNLVDSFEVNQSDNKAIDISGVEETSNKVTTLTQSSTNTQYPSAKVVYDVTEEIREIAAGKTKNYACSAVTNPELNSQADTITLTTALVDISGTTIPLSSLKLGDNIYLTQIDLPDRWYAGNNICYKLETAKVPVTDVKKNGVSVVSNTVADIEVPTKTSDITNDSGYITINDVPQEIFWCTYGTTTFAQIREAVQAGKHPICNYPDTQHNEVITCQLVYNRVLLNAMRLFRFYGTIATSSSIRSVILSIDRSDNTWSVQDMDVHDSTKQNVIDSSNKLSSDLVDDTNKTNKFVTTTDKTRFNALNVKYVDNLIPSEDIDLSTVEVDKCGADYGFTWDSQNLELSNENSGEHDNTFAYGKISFTILTDTSITVSYRQSSEQNYDYGELSTLDTELNVDRYPDLEDKLVFIGQSQGIIEGSHTYENVTAGEHFITFKYIKDSSGAVNDDIFAIKSIRIAAAGFKGLIDYDTEEELQSLPVEVDLSNYYTKTETENKFVTLNTQQTISAPKIIQIEEPKTYGGQDSTLKVLSKWKKTDIDVPMWAGRMMIGNETQTFLMGTYRGVGKNATLCGLGAHTWSSAKDQTGGAWEDVYIQPDGGKAVYIGDYGWSPNSGWLKVQNSNANTGGKVYYNKNSISAPSWQEVATLNDIASKENTSNKVTSISSSSTNAQYPSAKCVYDAVSAKSTVSVSSTGTATDEVYYITVDGVEKKIASSGGGTWGSIEGNLSDQTDLQEALDAKQNDIGFSIVDGELCITYTEE